MRAPDVKAGDAIVIGGGVSGLAAAWALARSGVRVTLVERSGRLGGLVETERPLPGVVLEHGADAILSGKPGGMPVLRALGLDGELVTGGRAPRRALVLEGEALLPMPAGLFAFERRALGTMLRTPLLSLGGKARMVLEPFLPRAALPDESVRSFFSRRLGPEVEARLVTPMVRGIYGADAADLGVRSVFPALAGFEDRFGSVALALLVASRSKAGKLVTPRGGMEEVPARLARQGGARAVLGRSVRSIEIAGGRWRVGLDDESVLEADRVVVATEVAAAARLLAPIAPELGELLGEVRATDVEVVSLVLPRSALAHALDASGFVVSGEGRATLACTFASEKWDGRAPDDLTVLRSVLRGDPRASEAELAGRAWAELRDVLGGRGEPSLWRVRRRPAALPAYGVGHAARIARVRAAAAALPGLALAGNYLGGVGVPDAIASGLSAAEALGAVSPLGAASPLPA